MRRVVVMLALAVAAGPVGLLGQTVQRPANAEEADALRLALVQAHAADSAPNQTIDQLNRRIERWSMVLLLAPSGSPEAAQAQAAVAQARADLQVARSRDFVAGNLDDASKGIFDAKLAAARDHLAVREWTLAEENIRYVLSKSPTYPPALSLQAELDRRRGELQRLLMLVGAGLLAVTLSITAVAVVRLGYRQRQQRRQAEAVATRAWLEVVEGAGAGKTVSIGLDRPVFRIGATDGARAGQKNDLILSDASKTVSRFHCNLLRSGGDYFLVDTSTNGTYVNGRRLNKGEHRLLGHEDEIVLADAARLLFRCR